MHLGNISFCDQLGYNIKSDDVKKKILEELETHIEFKVIQKHFQKYDPSSTPSVVQNRPHMMCVRTNGNPYLLLLTKCNFINQCIFIDKKIQQGYYYPRMIVTKLWFDDSLFEHKTVLDGEMVRLSEGKWIFVIHDILCDRGISLASWNLMRRVSRIYELLVHQFRPDVYDVCKLEVKRYFPINEARELVETFIPSLPYTCRGIYFKPLFQKFKDILLNFDDSLIKHVHRESYKDVGAFLLRSNTPPPIQKAIEEAKDTPATTSKQTDVDVTRVFYARKTNIPDVYHLYETSSSEDYQVACISNLKTSKMMRMLFSHCNPVDSIPMECLFSNRFQKWVPTAAVQT